MMPVQVLTAVLMLHLLQSLLMMRALRWPPTLTLRDTLPFQHAGGRHCVMQVRQESLSAVHITPDVGVHQR